MDPIHVVITIIAALAAVVVMRWAWHQAVAWAYFYVAPLALAIVIIAGFVPWYVTMLGLAGLIFSIIAIEKMSRVTGLQVVAAPGVALGLSPCSAFGFGRIATLSSVPGPRSAGAVNWFVSVSAAAGVTAPAVDGGTVEAPLVGMDAVVREDIIGGT